MTDGADRSNETSKGEGSGLRLPPGMNPIIARLIEELARAAVRREERHTAKIMGRLAE